MQEIIKKLKIWLIPWIAYILVSFTNHTLNLKVVGEDNLNDIDEDVPLLYAAWHGRSWIPVYYLRNRDYIALTSWSEDGEYMTRLLRKLGWKIIRGSSSSGGSRSLLKLFKQLKKGDSTALTPDGPKGPIYRVKPGIIYLQERTDGYIVPLGVAIDRKKVMNSWDQYYFPYPWSKAVLTIGKPLQFSPDKSIEERCRELEKEIHLANNQAEEKLTRFKKNGD